MVTPLNISHIIDVLEMIRSLMINDYLGVIMDAASVLAALLAGWAFIRISHDYVEGQGVTFWMFVKPLLIVVLVCNFDMFVLKPVHVMTTLFTDQLTESTAKAQTGFFQATAQVARKQFSSPLNRVKATANDDVSNTPELDQGRSEDEEEGGFWKGMKKIGAAIWAASTRISLSAREIGFVSITNVLYGLLNLLMHIVYYVQICLCYIFLILYGLLGPFTFAFSILGPFSRGIADWIARYIQTAFWIPVGQIIFLVGNQIMLHTAEIINGNVGALGSLSANAGPLAGVLSTFNIGSWFSIIFMLATMIAICQVGKICSYIIESTGTAGASAGIMQNAG